VFCMSYLHLVFVYLYGVSGYLNKSSQHGCLCHCSSNDDLQSQAFTHCCALRCHLCVLVSVVCVVIRFYN